MQKQRKKIQPLDKDMFYRWFHLHCFSHIFKILTSKQPKTQFAYPRFQLFKDIVWQYGQQSQPVHKLSLFVRCLITFWKQVAIGAFITIFFSCLNLLIPLMIKNFLHFMHEHHVDQNEISSTQILIEGFIILQLLRIIFGEHSKRLFHELAIKVESSLSLMIVKKSLSISNEVRNKISQSEILQLQNIDLRLVFAMFQNMYLAIQAPFTILLTIYLLYLENYKYGLIGIYWFIIAFLIQRQLDQKMTHCNDTKLQLIQARSKINYDIIGKIRTAKLLGHQQLLIQKNNDYFIAQNHDHKMFYEYVTLYDISLLMLPILVIVTIALYDLNEPNPISVSQVYVLLSLLGICYVPMKSFRTLTLNFHDGLRSMKRIDEFLRQPDQPPNERLKIRAPHKIQNSKKSRKDSLSSEQSKGSLNEIYSKSKVPSSWPLVTISKNLLVNPGKQQTRIKLHINMQQNLNFHHGQRIVVVGKVGSGIETFFQSLIGLAKIDQGQIKLNDRIAYLNQEHFFRNTTVRQNIRFFNKQVTDQQINRVYKLLKLDQDLKLTAGLQGNIDDEYKYNSVQLHKISLARVLCSNAQIYLLDKVFQPLNSADQKLLQEILRQKQSEGKLIILLNYPNNTFQKDDKILIFQKGAVKQLGTYEQMIQTQNKIFKQFYHIKSKQQQLQTQRQMDIFSQFGTKLSLNFASLQQHPVTKQQKQRIINRLGNSILVYSMHLWKEYKQQTHKKITNYGIRHYIWKFLSAVKLTQFIYIFLIIAVAQLMHIFIHFYIGHLEEEHGENNYIKFRDMIIVEFVLTVGLAGIIWLEGEVSSEIAIIQGNNLYKNSLTSLGQNKLSWFEKEYSVKIANRFNHDYEQVFIMLHMLLNIYKNVVILIATIYFLSESKKSLIIMTFAISVTYLTVYWIVRSVERRVVNYFEEFKYHYVRVLEESIGGAKLIQLHGASDAVIQNAKLAYKQFASYKVAESYTAYGEEIFCDLVSLVIFTAVLNYGLQSKVQGNTKSIAQIATMIHLLIGVFDVLKTIVKDSVHFQTFFKINLLPFVEIIKQKSPQTQKVEEHIQKSIIEFEQEVIKKSQQIRQSLLLQKTAIKQSNISIHEVSDILGKIGDSVSRTPNKLHIHSNECAPNKNHLLQLSNSRMKRTLSVQKIISPYIKYDIEFRNVTLHQSKYHQPVFQVYPLSVKIGQGQKVLFYEENDYLKNYLIYALTKNLPMFFNPEIMGLQRTEQQIKNKQKTILIGGRDICCIEKNELEKIVQILIDHDFYVQGTLEDNIAWKNHNFDYEQVLGLAEYLQFRRQLPSIVKHGLKAKIKQPSKQLIKKMTVLRILSLKPKIVIIKDTESIIENFLLVDEIRRFIGPVTIIKISSNIDEAFDIDRIIYTKNLQLNEDRLKQDAINNPFSSIGDDLRKANLSGMVYANKMNMTLIGAKFGLPNELIQ